MSDVIYIDVEEGLKRVVNNASLYSKLLAKFKNYTHLNDIESALAEGDFPKAQNSTHTLKGLAANLSLTELYKKVQELEAQLKTGSAFDEQISTVKNVYIKTLEEVDKVISKYA